MTGAQAERVSIPGYVTASAVLLRLASPFFKPAYDLDDSARWEAYGTYSTLRQTAERILERRGLVLTATETTRLQLALCLCPAGPDREYMQSLQFTTGEAVQDVA